MPNSLGLAGAQSQKPTRFAPLYTGRWSSGLWTNRSPLRDANTSRVVEKFYGAAGDALMAGANVEITNRLTLARRPGCSLFDDNTYDAIICFKSFRMFAPNEERIYVMVDESGKLSYTYGGDAFDIFDKSTGAGQTYMQAVGNSLYFGNGVDNKKWMQSLAVWSSGATWDSPADTITFLIDPNGNVQQLTNNSGTAAVSGTTPPTWGTTKPDHTNDFQGGTTSDGTCTWTNRGDPLQNWGIVAPTAVPTVNLGSSRVAWTKNTYYSYAGVIIDSNGNLQKVTTAGTSGPTTHPTWATSVGLTTVDNTVTWTMLQTAASLVWAAHTVYAPGAYVVGNASGVNCLFQLNGYTLPTIVGSVDAWAWNDSPHSGPVSAYPKFYPVSTGGAGAHATGNSLSFDVVPNISTNPFKWSTFNAAGETTGTTTPFAGYTNNTNYVIHATLHIPVAGQYTFKIVHHDGIIFGIGGGASKVSGTFSDPGFSTNPHTQTAAYGYPIMGGNNSNVGAVSSQNTDTMVVNFPTAGDYPIEIDWDMWYHSGLELHLTVNGFDPVPGTPISGAIAPIWPGWTTSYAPNYPTATEAAGQMVWSNLGPASDYVWAANIGFTEPNTTIIDNNGNTQAPYRTGPTGTVRPTFATGLNQLTNDNPNLIWINKGASAAPTPGTVSTYNGGWQYCLALVNSLDNTVSNCGKLSDSTGNFIGASGVSLAAGEGLPNPSVIDPQCDYVAIFRTTDGGATPFLIQGPGPSIWTVPLVTYLTSGYTDTAADVELNNLITGAILGENTPPKVGAKNLIYHLNRIFFSVGNVVYWTAGPDTPCGNGVNGVPPLNFNEFPSLVQRIVPTVIGALVFTVSDVYLIRGNGTINDPLQSGQPYLKGIGLANHNALDMNGTVIGLYTTDKQFVVLDASSGVSYVGYPIGDQLRKNNGLPGTSWDTTKVYVTWYVNGEDQGWYLSDGQNGWFRLMTTPAPETGLTWSPFASVVNGCKAVQAIEVAPGVHKLLVGPTASGNILTRDLTANSDNGTSYPAWAVVGSAVLAQPGQIAEVAFITTDSINVGTPVIMGVLLDEAWPIYTGPFEILKNWVNDPPGLPKSRSILGQRFYLCDSETAAVCRHLQMMVAWTDEDAPNELLALTLFGAYQQEI